MSPNRRKVLHSIWRFLNQPVFNRQKPVILNVHKFWQVYQIEYLERCLAKTYRPEERFRS